MNAQPRCPLSRVVASTPMQPASFQLLRSTFWTESGVVICHIEELPVEVQAAVSRWASTQFGSRMKRR